MCCHSGMKRSVAKALPEMMRIQLHSRRYFVGLGAALVSGISVQGIDGKLANLSGPRFAIADEPPEKPQSAPKNHALLVGVSHYEHAEMNRKQLRGYPKCLFQAATRYLNGACDSPGAMRVTICWMARIRIMHSDESVRRS